MKQLQSLMLNASQTYLQHCHVCGNLGESHYRTNSSCRPLFFRPPREYLMFKPFRLYAVSRISSENLSAYLCTGRGAQVASLGYSLNGVTGYIASRPRNPEVAHEERAHGQCPSQSVYKTSLAPSGPLRLEKTLTLVVRRPANGARYSLPEIRRLHGTWKTRNSLLTNGTR